MICRPSAHTASMIRARMEAENWLTESLSRIKPLLDVLQMAMYNNKLIKCLLNISFVNWTNFVRQSNMKCKLPLLSLSSWQIYNLKYNYENKYNLKFTSIQFGTLHAARVAAPLQHRNKLRTERYRFRYVHTSCADEYLAQLSEPSDQNW